jgi:hypothetical protein
MLDGQIGDVQLRAIEARRDGADDLWVTLKIRAIRIDHAPGQHEAAARLNSRSGELSFAVASSEWLAQWKRAQTGIFLEVLIPLTGHPDYAQAAGRVVEAPSQLCDCMQIMSLVAWLRCIDRGWGSTTFV